MIKILNIGSETNQRHTILFEGGEITLVLKFLPVVGIWTFDVEWKSAQILNIKLSVGVQHINNYNLPFDFVCEDTTGSGLDPTLRDDFQTGRTVLYMLEAQDLVELRGYEVEI